MTPSPRWRIVARDGDATVVVDLADDLAELRRRRCTREQWRAEASATGGETRWVWSDTGRWYPDLLAAGIVVERCHDLRLSRAIVRSSALVTRADVRATTAWDASPAAEPDLGAPALFDLDTGAAGVPDDPDAVLAEFLRQQDAVATATDPGRLRLLLAAESAGALLAAELTAAGVPWSRAVHERILEEALGPRPAAGAAPARVQELAAAVRAALGDPSAGLDSQPKLLRSLHRVGVLARTTSRWELAEYDHPAIAPLLQYKKLTRLLSANGWTWLDEWAREGRFRPVYVPGGVVTGRWASSGGGALQLPRQLRPAVRADPGWMLVVADVAQLEPRVLAALSGDLALADAARGRDLYDGVVAGGAVSTRADAKIAMLGAMYGATTGDSGRLVPALRRAYPRAMGLVDAAARTGEEGGTVSTWLGRTSPAASAGWRAVQDRAGAPDAGEPDRERARRAARDRGRFTRNFVVQGTAAEWALAWLADLRRVLGEMPPVEDGDAADASGAVFSRRAHLCFFLHDEIIVHTPAAHAEAVAAAVRESANRAASLLFGGFPIDFPLDLRITADAAKA
ncbi:MULTISPECIES: bifunctional 3'-5' exonuclease/DNA polymerase [unclassified Microbacterium]|uniref:bifunctional 3'-5' exonuclease/DNA polymerase n=1 Tax=unclassified Microbacterium TaxID=2609290 RepID=UPI00301A471A